MPCSEQSWVVPCSLLLQAGKGDWEGIAPREWVWGLPCSGDEEEGFILLPLRCDPLTFCPLCSPSMGVCCPGQTWCPTPLFAELFALPDLPLDFLCGCTNIWHIINSNRSGLDRARIAAPPPNDNFGFSAHHTKGKGNRAESLNISQRYTISMRKCTEWWSWLWEKYLLFQISRWEEILALPSANL